TTGQTAIHREFRWPSAWTRLAAHLDFATAAVNRRDERKAERFLAFTSPARTLICHRRLAK
ncbi:hypothetical protein ACFYS7_37345, partial [Streptomyces avermitilis]